MPLRLAAAALAAGALVLAACSTDSNETPADSLASDEVASRNEVEVVPLGGDVGMDGGRDGQRPVLGDLIDDDPVVLNFFSSTCVPCVEEMPAIQAVHEDLGDMIDFVGISSEPSEDAAREIVDETGVTYPTFHDPMGDALFLFEGIGLPTTVFMQPDGEVLDVHTGELTESALSRKIDDLFGVTRGST